MITYNFGILSKDIIFQKSEKSNNFYEHIDFGKQEKIRELDFKPRILDYLNNFWNHFSDDPKFSFPSKKTLKRKLF